MSLMERGKPLYEHERQYQALRDAAPTLLEALVKCRNRLLVKGMIGDTADEAALDAARAAINAATGGQQ